MRLRNITLSARESTIEEARRRAREQKTTLNALFRQWLAAYANQGNAADTSRSLMQKLHYADAAGAVSRRERHER